MRFSGSDPHRIPRHRAHNTRGSVRMQIPVKVCFRDMPVSDAVEAQCWAEAEQLRRIDDRVASCRVDVAETGHCALDGSAYRINVELRLAEEALAVVRDPPVDHEDDIFRAVREAFELARRRLPAVQS